MLRRPRLLPWAASLSCLLLFVSAIISTAQTNPPPVSFVRSFTNDLPDQPLVTVTVTGAVSVACFTIEETLPGSATAQNISAGGNLLPALGVIRWGPFTNTIATNVSYRLSGMPASYPVNGGAWMDGQWYFSTGETMVTVQAAGGNTSVPTTPPQVSSPIFTPISGASVPTNVTISCTTTGAMIYYTLDGSLPTPASTLYTGTVYLASASTVRARAFTNGWTPSIAGVAFYGPPPTPLALQMTRSVNTNQPSLPGLNLAVTPGTNAVCIAVEEWLPPGLTPLGISSNGVFDANHQVIRWGPFYGSNALNLSYYLFGDPGQYALHATWSVDGQTSGEAQGTNVTVVSGSGGLPLILVNHYYARAHWFDLSSPTEISMLLPPASDTQLILYSLDGNEPYLDYTAPFVISESCVIRAAIYDAAYNKISEADPVTVQILPFYSLTNLNPGGGVVTVSPDLGPYASGTIVTLSASSDPGWLFLRWEGDLSGTGATNSLLMDGPKTVKAVFGTSLGTNVVPSGAGYVERSPDQASYAYGAGVRLSAVPTGSYYFGQWQNAAAGQTNTPLLFVVTNANTNVTARFYPLSGSNRSLAVVVKGAGAVIRTPYRNYYTNGDTVLLSAVPESGSPFAGWSGDATGTNNPLSVVMDKNRVITATFGTNALSANNQPPTVSITNPISGAVFSSPANITLNATASDADGTVAQVAFFDGTNLLGSLTNAPFNFTWTNAAVGTNLLTAVATDNFSATATSAVVSVTVNLPAPGPAMFTLSTNSYSVQANGGSVAVTIQKNFNSVAAMVNFSTADGSAVAYANGFGNYAPASGSLSFTNGELSKTVNIQIYPTTYYVGNRTFSFQLSASGDGSSLGSPGSAVITIVDVNTPASTNSFPQSSYPSSLPAHNGQLRVSLTPTNAAGQWRLVRESVWRNSGDTAGNLATGNYEVEFKPAPGFVPPGNTTNSIVAGALTSVTNVYAVSFDTPQFGSLTLTLTPTAAVTAGAQWRILGDSVWRNSGYTLTNLLAGPQVIEFKSASGWVTPSLQWVTVSPDQNNGVTVNYPSPDATGGVAPIAVPFADATQPASLSPPYPWNGQLLSDVGYGSGFVVKQRVVLTAAHVVFNDSTLAYVTGVKWFFQRYAGSYEPPTQTPRGWYVFDSYSAARTNDHSPGVSSPTSQNLDVAALYFMENAGRGGYGGYLVSDPSGTEWLQVPGSKTLIGYPVEGVSDTARGQMYFTPALSSIHFTAVTNRVFKTSDLYGYPGMSGGPLCVQYTNNAYFPAAVYLGGSGQGIVRAIDGAVADLINKADTTANTGNDFVGGGVISLSAGNGGLFATGNFQIALNPPEAIAAGAGWRVTALTNNPGAYYSDGTATYGLPAANYTLTFHDATGYLTPPNRPLAVVANQTAALAVTYTNITPRSLPVGTSNGVVQLAFSATVGQRYALERSTNLTAWAILLTNTVGTNGLLRVDDSNLTNHLQRAFYRARFVP